MNKRFLGVLVLVCAAADAATQVDTAQAEVYAIYSAMMTSQMTRQRNTADEIYLIEENTTTNSGGPGCVKAPPEEAAVLAEVVEDYSRRSSTSVALTRHFTLPKPYELMDRDKTREFLRDALNATPQFLAPGTVQPVNQNPLFPKAKQVFRFSEVYFDKSHTRALAYVAIYTTSVDYVGTWRPYKKSANGAWEENRSWTACGTGVVR